MPTVFCLTVRFLDPVASFHGRGDGGEPEWPPSPLRLFQALVAAAATRWRSDLFFDYAQPALQWLETRQPAIVAPGIQVNRTGYRMYVPNNAADLVTSAWARGNTEASIAEHRVEKDVLPSRLVGSDSVHYCWDLPEPLPADVPGYLNILTSAASSMTHLGWGIDMVAANAVVISDTEASKLPGERWQPMQGSAIMLRVPVEGTLTALTSKHTAFLTRLGSNGFKPVPPLSAFAVIGYRRETESVSRPFAAFSILKPDASGNRSFDPVRRTRDVAAWVRHVTGTVCAGWPFGSVASFVHGHDPLDNTRQLKGAQADERFLYLPLPTINGTLKRVEAIRRVLIAAPAGFQDRIDWIRRRLPGQELIWDDNPVGLLNLLPTSDWVLRQYTEASSAWATVTPVVLPGYDDPKHLRRRLQEPMTAEAKKRLYERLDARIEGLLRKAIVQAGFSPTLADCAELSWRQVGFCPGLDLANRYCTPEHLRGKPRYHVRIRWRDAANRTVQVRGPIALGAGRYCGLGLFVAESGEPD